MYYLMAFCDFVVSIYLIVGVSSLQLISIAIRISLPKLMSLILNSRPQTIFNQMGVVSGKVGVVKQIFCYVCAPPPPPPRKKKILYETLPYLFGFPITLPGLH